MIGDRFDQALAELLNEAYQRGLSDGLAVAERIAGWLTRQPQSKQLREIETWARRAIAEAEGMGQTAEEGDG